MYSIASLVAENEHEENAPFEETSTPFHKWPRKDKRAFVERFCSITTPPNQNGASKNLQLNCNYCDKSFKGQLITALVHIAGVRKGGQRVSVCPTPNEEIKSEVLHLFSLDNIRQEEVLNDEALHGGEHFHHPNAVELQLQQQQQQQHFLQNASKLASVRDRATAKRKREYAMKTLQADPNNPIDLSILRFLADADLKPKVIESESFQEMVRVLRAAPKTYVLPGAKRGEESVFAEGMYGSSSSAGSSGGNGGNVNNHMVLMQNNLLGNNVPHHHNLHQHNLHLNHANPHNSMHLTHEAEMHHTSEHAHQEAHKRARSSNTNNNMHHEGTHTASVDAGSDSEDDQSVNTLPQI